MKLKVLAIGLGIIIIGLIIAVVWPKPTMPLVTSFEECAALYPVMESYPEQCDTPDGKHFVRDISSVEELGKQFTLNLKGKARFSGGFTVVLDRIEDSRCKQGVQCIWAGELSPVLLINDSQEIRLGTITKQKETFEIHSFTLISATETSATILVSLAKIDNVVSNGKISGYVHIGPTCPVERMPPDPNCADKPFSVPIQIYSSDMSLQKSVTSDTAGHFEISLPVGEYVLRPPQGTNIGSRCAVETRVKVNKGAVTNVDIACDSGIR